MKGKSFLKGINQKKVLKKRKGNLDLQIIQNFLTKKEWPHLRQMKIKEKVNLIEKKDLKIEKDQKNFLLKNIEERIKIIF